MTVTELVHTFRDLSCIIQLISLIATVSARTYVYKFFKPCCQMCKYISVRIIITLSDLKNIYNVKWPTDCN